MSFTYEEDASNIENADYVSAIRFALQDAVETGAAFSDEEIGAQYGATDDTLTQRVRNLSTVVRLAWALHKRYAKQASFSSGKTTVQLLERAKYWRTAAMDAESDLQTAAAADNGFVGEGGVLFAGRQTSFEDALGVSEGAQGGGTLGGYIVR